MAKSLVSNPHYNLKWEVPMFAQLQKRFSEFTVPPKSNANFAFILTALEQIDEKAALLLPCGVLSTDNSDEKSIRKELILKNLIEAVIILPDKMFESTSIPTCILVLSKIKKTQKIEMIDLRQEFSEEIREQNGQFGGKAHENRTYKKSVKIITDDTMTKALNSIKNNENIAGFCQAVSVDEIRKCDFSLVPSRYIEFIESAEQHRDFADIAADYNRIVREKNALKLTVNESLAKTLGLYDVYLNVKNQPPIEDSFAFAGQKVEKENFITISKNAAEFKIENKCKERFPEILLLFIQQWKQHLMFLNTEENRILAEFRDALIPDLMSGKINLDKK